jgi:hypothetical protein
MAFRVSQFDTTDSNPTCNMDVCLFSLCMYYSVPRMLAKDLDRSMEFCQCYDSFFQIYLGTKTCG